MRATAAAGLGVLALVACSTVQVRTDYDPAADFSRYRTYAFSGGKTVRRLGGLQVNEPFVSDRIRADVGRQLELKGLTPNLENPDLLVTFVAGARERTELESAGVPYYSSLGWWGWGPGWWGPGYEDWWAYHYTETTLIMDLIDAHTKKLVWRAYTRADMNDMASTSREIDRAVTKAFRRFPPVGPQPAYGGSGPGH